MFRFYIAKILIFIDNDVERNKYLMIFIQLIVAKMS